MAGFLLTVLIIKWSVFVSLFFTKPKQFHRKLLCTGILLVNKVMEWFIGKTSVLTDQFPRKNTGQFPSMVRRVCDAICHRNNLGLSRQIIITNFPRTYLVGYFQHCSDVSPFPRPKLRLIVISRKIIGLSVLRRNPDNHGCQYATFFLVVASFYLIRSLWE